MGSKQLPGTPVSGAEVVNTLRSITTPSVCAELQKLAGAQSDFHFYFILAYRQADFIMTTAMRYKYY